MPLVDPDLKEIKGRLGKLVQCVLAKAEADAEFADQLKQVLLSDRQDSQPPKPKPLPIFDPVAFLSHHGVNPLREALDGKPTSELKAIIRKCRAATPKTIKSKEREELIAMLVAYAEQRLNQGGVFLNSDIKSDPSPGIPPTPQERDHGEQAALDRESSSVT